MKFSQTKAPLLIAALALGGLLLFQNCAKVAFNSGTGATTTKAAQAGPSQVDPQEEEVGSCRLIAKSQVSIVGSDHLVSCDGSSDVKCALVCHVPPGNPAARHNIIVGISARNGPHQPGGHGGDYDGPCSDTAPTFEACHEAK